MSCVFPAHVLCFLNYSENLPVYPRSIHMHGVGALVGHGSNIRIWLQDARRIHSSLNDESRGTSTTHLLGKNVILEHVHLPRRETCRALNRRWRPRSIHMSGVGAGVGHGQIIHIWVDTARIATTRTGARMPCIASARV